MAACWPRPASAFAWLVATAALAAVAQAARIALGQPPDPHTIAPRGVFGKLSDDAPRIVPLLSDTLNKEAQTGVPRDRAVNLGPCRTCIWMLERMQQRLDMLLSGICIELFHKHPNDYKWCMMVDDAIHEQATNLHAWLYRGCYEIVGEQKTWRVPCPARGMCQLLRDLDKNSFCRANVGAHDADIDYIASLQ
jgi:hypothetical protein